MTRPPAISGDAIFGFGEFIGALALLVLVFNSTDYLYRFRITVAPFPLILVTFLATIVIGIGTLVTDLWFAERWLSFPWGISRAELQALLGLLFLFVTLLWIWFAYIRPPIYSRWNSQHFYREMFRSVVRGSDVNLHIVGAEVARSAKSLVNLAAPRASRFGIDGSQQAPTKAQRFAHDTLLMLGNRKLCRHIVATSPITAIAFMQEAHAQKRYDVPLGEFARNITTEALLNKDSILYLEDGLYASDLVGIIQPFSKAMYGDYRLVERLSSGRYSPFDLDWRVAWALDGSQFDAYCRVVLITLKNYVEGGHYLSSSNALYRAFEIIKDAGREVGRLDGIAPDGELQIATQRLQAAIGFVKDTLDFLSEQKDLNFGQLRVRGVQGFHETSLFDRIAELIFELVHHASYVRSPADRVWAIHYNVIWGRLRGEGQAWKVVRHKLFRLIFDEFKEMERWPNYQGARLLGFCLNVLGLSEGTKTGYGHELYPFRKAVLRWTRRNYLAIVRANADIAAYCLSGGISFEAENKRLIKTYIRGTNVEPAREFLTLDDPLPMAH